MTLASNEFIHLILCSGCTSNFILLSLARPTYRFLSAFLLSCHRNCLRFMLRQINVSINKNKFCQEKSGMNQFWLDASHVFPPLRLADEFCSSRAAQSSTISISLLTTKTFFKIGHFSSSMWNNTFNNSYLAGCKYTLQWNARWETAKVTKAMTDTNTDICPNTSLWTVQNEGSWTDPEERKVLNLSWM